MAKAYNPFEVAQEHVDKATKALGLDEATCELLRNPQREM